MNFPFALPGLDPISFFAGFAAGIVFWVLIGKAKPILAQLQSNLQERRAAAQQRTSSNVEENHRRQTLHQAQGLHLAAPLFSLDEILQIPKLLPPPASAEPGAPPATEDITSQVIPHMPAWPELSTLYKGNSLSLQNALSGGAHLVITGQPGTGKTVALAYLATLAANRDESLGELSTHTPFLLHVADLGLPANNPDDTLSPMINFISETSPVFDLPKVPGFVEHTFKSGQALLLLDGLDELAPDQLHQASAYLEALLKTYPKTRVVTTGYQENLGGLIKLGFTAMAILPWHADQQREFLSTWSHLWHQYVTLEAWAQKELQNIDPLLLQSWLLKEDLVGLSPLEYTLKVWAAFAGDLRGAGVVQAIEAHIRRLSPENTPSEALEMVGMQVNLTAQAVFDPRKARDWVKKFEVDELITEPASDSEQPDSPAKGRGKISPKDTPSRGLLAKLAESGLLINHSTHLMRFSHPVFSAVLAGKAFSEFSPAPLLKQAHWSGKMLSLHYLAVYGDPTVVVNTFLAAPDKPLYIHLLNMGRWLKDAPQNAGWRNKVFAQLLALLQTEGLPLGLRAQAVAAFAFSKDNNVRTLFKQLVQVSGSAELTRLAALGCGATKETSAVEILSGLFHNPNPNVRKAACLALAAIGTVPALEAAATALLTGDEDLRRAAAEALANDPKEGHAMLRDGTGMEDILVRRSVVYGLIRVNQPWAIEILEKIQIDDEQWIVRNAAAEALEDHSQNKHYTPQKLTKPSETPWLIAFAGKQGMGVSPTQDPTDILLSALKHGEIDEQLAALAYLKRKPTPAVISALYHLMYDQDAEMREAAFHAVTDIASSGQEIPDPMQFGLG